MPEPIGPEQNPQNIPLKPAGAIDPRTKGKLGAGLLLAMFAVVGVWVYFTRPSKPVVQKPAQTIGTPKADAPSPGANPRKPDTAMDADAYQRGFNEGAQRAREMDRMGMSPDQPERQGAAAYLPTSEPKPKFSLADLDHDAAFAENVVVMRERREQIPQVVASQTAPPAGQSAQEQPKAQNETIQHLSGIILPGGTVIPAVLLNDLQGEFTGPVIAQVSANVYRPLTREIVIPQGARLIGEASKVGGQNQERLAVSFHRAIWESAKIGQFNSISFDRLVGLDQQGAAALKDKVKRHYLQTFGAALAIGAIGGLAQIGNASYGGAYGFDTGVEFRNGITQSMAQSSQQILNHFLNRMPTIEIRPGHIVNVVLVYDLT
jgi:type IV secretion system protein VirB10